MFEFGDQKPSPPMEIGKLLVKMYKNKTKQNKKKPTSLNYYDYHYMKCIKYDQFSISK